MVHRAWWKKHFYFFHLNQGNTAVFVIWPAQKGRMRISCQRKFWITLSLEPKSESRWSFFYIFAISTYLSMPPCLSFSVTLLSLQARPRNCPLRPQPHQAWSQWSGPHFTYPGPFLWPGLWVRQERVWDPKVVFIWGDREESTPNSH